MNGILHFIAAGILLGWGIAHVIPTKSVVKGFGETTIANKRIITMTLVSLMTGFKVNFFSFKLCPLIFMTAAT